MDDRACCCPSRPVMRVLMPPTPERPHPVEFLLCGHHFRVSQWTLAAAGAVAHPVTPMSAGRLEELALI